MPRTLGGFRPLTPIGADAGKGGAASATILISDGFSGTDGTSINGRTPDTIQPNYNKTRHTTEWKRRDCNVR